MPRRRILCCFFSAVKTVMVSPSVTETTDQRVHLESAMCAFRIVDFGKKQVKSLTYMLTTGTCSAQVRTRIFQSGRIQKSGHNMRSAGCPEAATTDWSLFIHYFPDIFLKTTSYISIIL